ncbi:cathepsin D [Malassezia caprae]|uniref:Cathepsin D n=1 Tax=Malassezia caprae TaxID=1381934 RepID=A0AAF0E4W1_9BASI|nr:cathepsin D [Malassezia caprae]
MFLYFKAVLGLLAATLAAAESTGNFSIPLTRRQDTALLGSDQTETFSSDFNHVVIKYSTAFENYFRNMGKQHHLQVGQLLKRGDEGSVGLRNVDNGLLWTGHVQFGSPPQSIYVDFDTGSADTLVNPGAYKPGSSLSSHNTNKSFSNTYGDGRKANGTIYTDKFSIGDINGKHVAIGLAKKDFIASRESPNKGISGLSMPSIQTFPSAYKPFFQTLRDQGAVSQGIFQFTIKTGSGSSLHLGGIDSSKYTGSITWVDFDPSDGFYVAPASINGKEIRTIIDSGTSLIIGPPSEVKDVLQSIDGVTISDQQGQIMATFPCNKNPKVNIKYGSKTFPLANTHLKQNSTTCVLPVMGRSGLPMKAWIMGDPFFQSASVIFDQEKNRLGFAKQA